MSPPPSLVNSAETSDGTSRVPTRFGMGGMLFLITIFCALFALLKWVGAPGVVYLVSTLFVLVVGGAQMRWGETPRVISLAAGAIFLPLSVIAVSFNAPNLYAPQLACLVTVTIPIGAFFGYVAGAVLAGFFLVSRMIDDGSERGRLKPVDTFTSDPPPPARWTERPVEAEVVEAEIIEEPRRPTQTNSVS